MNEMERLWKAAQYCSKHGEREYGQGGAKGANESAWRLLSVAYQLVEGIKRDIAMEDAGMVVVRDAAECERIEEVEATIGSMIVNLQKFKETLIEKGEGCKWCVFNLLNDIDALYGLMDEYAPKETAA